MKNCVLGAAGRYDLHHAIKYHGGYVEAGRTLGRQAAWPRFADLTNSRVLAKEIRGFQRDQGADEALLPSARALLEADRADLLQVYTDSRVYSSYVRV